MRKIHDVKNIAAKHRKQLHKQTYEVFQSESISAGRCFAGTALSSGRKCFPAYHIENLLCIYKNELASIGSLRRESTTIAENLNMVIDDYYFTESVDNGETATDNATVNSGGDMGINYGDIGNMERPSWSIDVGSGKSVTNITVNSNCTMRVYSGGRATSTTVNNDGVMEVSLDGSITDTTVNGYVTFFL